LFAVNGRGIFLSLKGSRKFGDGDWAKGYCLLVTDDNQLVSLLLHPVYQINKHIGHHHTGQMARYA